MAPLRAARLSGKRKKNTDPPTSTFTASSQVPTDLTSQILIEPVTSVDNQVFKDAIDKVTRRLDPIEKEAFMKSYERISPEKTLQTIRDLDDSDAASGVRKGMKALEPAIGVLNTAMNSVTISIQHNPEISSLVVGGIRLVIDLVAKFVHFYSKLSQMICQVVDYLEVFSHYSKLSHDTIVHQPLVDVYGDVITFCVEARLVFVDREGAVKKFGHFRTFFRVQWQPFEEKFRDIDSSFRHHLVVLTNSTQALQLGIMNEQFAAIKLGFNASETERIRVQSKDQTSERRQFLEWVSGIDYEEIFSEIIKKKHPGTGEWLLNHETFKNWAQNKKSELLWCHGKPGAGKSVLSSLVLDDASAIELNNPDVCVLFAYYSYQAPQRHPLAKLLGTFIRQLCTKLMEIPQVTLNFFQKYHRDAKTPNADDLEAHFYELLSHFPFQIIVIIDGLDECESDSREDVLNFVARLVNKQFKLFKVFVTSRKEEDIEYAFDRCPVVEIDSSLVDEDIRIFLKEDIERRIQNKSLKLRNQALKGTILENLSAKANGMFLWAKLQLDWISKQRGDSNILEELESLPPSLYATYDRILEKIEQRPPKQKELARKALMWIIYAKRPLELEELVDALTIREDITQCHILRDLRFDKDDILGICGGLLVVPKESNYYHSVQLIHYSLFEYFTATTLRNQRDLREKYFTAADQAHLEITSSCIDYLRLDIFHSGPHSSCIEAMRNMRYWQLSRYSTYYFDKHVIGLDSITPEIIQKMNALLSSDTKHIAAILQCRRWRGEEFFIGSQFAQFTMPVNAATLLISTALYDMKEFSQLHLKWTQDSLPIYSLHQAALSGSHNAVSRLLDSGLVDVNEKDDEGLTPLMHASGSGFFSIVHLLIFNWKAAVNSTHSEPGGQTALKLACQYGHTSIVRMLIENEATIGEEDPWWACQHTCQDDAILELLLENGAVATSFALENAVVHGFIGRCILLLDHGAFVTSEALTLAFDRHERNGALSKTLEEHCTIEMFSEADVSWASGSGCKDDSTLENLLKDGAVATSRALIEAINGCSTNRCILLLDRGALVTAEALVAAWGWPQVDDAPGSNLSKLLISHSTTEVYEEAKALYMSHAGRYTYGIVPNSSIVS